MLLDSLEREETQIVHNVPANELYLSSKIEIVPMQPIEWIYGEIKLKKDEFDVSISPIRRS